MERAILHSDLNAFYASVEKTIEKLSAPAVALLEAAKVDVTALITSAGEAWIATLKQEQN